MLWKSMFPALTLALAAMPSIASAQAAHTAAEDLAETDRAFSTVGARANIADSIGAMLMDNAVMPTPKLDFAIGRSAIVAALKANPANAAARAEWEPVRVGVSADRTQGFTFGFMTIHETGKPDRRAKYLSYWVRRPEGWRVAFYKRAASPEGSVTARLDPALPPASVEPDPQRIQENLRIAQGGGKGLLRSRAGGRRRPGLRRVRLRGCHEHGHRLRLHVRQ